MIAPTVTSVLGVTAVTRPDLFSRIPTVAVALIMATAVAATLLSGLPSNCRARHELRNSTRNRRYTAPERHVRRVDRRSR